MSKLWDLCITPEGEYLLWLSREQSLLGESKMIKIEEDKAKEIIENFKLEPYQLPF